MTEKLNLNPEGEQTQHEQNSWDTLGQEVPFTGDQKLSQEKVDAMFAAGKDNLEVAERADKLAQTATTDFSKSYAQHTAEMQRGFAAEKAEQAAKDFDANKAA